MRAAAVRAFSGCFCFGSAILCVALFWWMLSSSLLVNWGVLWAIPVYAMRLGRDECCYWSYHVDAGAQSQSSLPTIPKYHHKSQTTTWNRNIDDCYLRMFCSVNMGAINIRRTNHWPVSMYSIIMYFVMNPLLFILLFIAHRFIALTLFDLYFRFQWSFFEKYTVNCSTAWLHTSSSELS